MERHTAKKFKEGLLGLFGTEATKSPEEVEQALINSGATSPFVGAKQLAQRLYDKDVPYDHSTKVLRLSRTGMALPDTEVNPGEKISVKVYTPSIPEYPQPAWRRVVDHVLDSIL